MSRTQTSVLDRIAGAINAGIALLLRRHTCTDIAIQGLLVQEKLNGRKLDQILSILLEPAQIAGTVLSFEGEPMSPTADFTFQDDGKALLTISFVDAIGEATKPADGATISTTFSSSDAGVTVTDRGDGLNADVALSVPPPASLPVGVVITAVTTVTNADGTVLGPFTSTAQPIDVLPGPIAGTVIVASAE